MAQYRTSGGGSGSEEDKNNQTFRGLRLQNNSSAINTTGSGLYNFNYKNLIFKDCVLNNSSFIYSLNYIFNNSIKNCFIINCLIPNGSIIESGYYLNTAIKNFYIIGSNEIISAQYIKVIPNFNNGNIIIKDYFNMSISLGITNYRDVNMIFDNVTNSINLQGSTSPFMSSFIIKNISINKNLYFNMNSYGANNCNFIFENINIKLQNSQVNFQLSNSTGTTLNYKNCNLFFINQRTANNVVGRIGSNSLKFQSASLYIDNADFFFPNVSIRNTRNYLSIKNIQENFSSFCFKTQIQQSGAIIENCNFPTSKKTNLYIDSFIGQYSEVLIKNCYLKNTDYYLVIENTSNVSKQNFVFLNCFFQENLSIQATGANPYIGNLKFINSRSSDGVQTIVGSAPNLTTYNIIIDNSQAPSLVPFISGKLININIYYNNNGKNCSIYNILNGKSNTRRCNIYCNDISVLMGTTPENSLTGTDITQSAMTNGYQNTAQNIYLYNNYNY